MSRERSGRWVLLELGVPLVLLGWLAWRWLGRREHVLVDDAYISFRYARNLAAGWGAVWNAGERVEGYTSPLWILLLAPLSRLGLDLTGPAVLASLAFSVATIVLQWHVVRTAAPDAGLVLRLLPALLLATNPSWAHAAASAMETSCFAFFVLGALFFLVRSREEPVLRRHATLCFCAAYLTRPEGALVAAVAIGVELLSTSGPGWARVLRLAPTAAALGAVIGVHIAFRLHYYGYPLPNTFYAKVILGPVTLKRGVLHVLAFLRAGGWIVLPGLVESFRRGPLRAYLVQGHSVLVAYVAYLTLVGGDHPYWFRFYMPLLALPLVATSQLVARLGDAFEPELRRLVPGRARLAASALSAFGFAGVVSWDADAHAESRDVLGSVNPGYARSMRAIAAFFRQDTPAGSLIGVMPVGYVGYYVPDARILDMWGLNDVHTAHLDVAPTFKFGHDKLDMAYIARQKIDYAFVFRPLDSRAAPPVPGYDVCWPSVFTRFAVYRRAYLLDDDDAHLGVPPQVTRYLEPPPRCPPPPTTEHPAGGARRDVEPR